jgi:hypothetical protein
MDRKKTEKLLLCQDGKENEGELPRSLPVFDAVSYNPL